MRRLGIPWEATVGELTASIFCREFVPVYEPVVHLTTGAVLGWRVDGRWIHPTRGLVTAAEYAPRADQAGLLDPIDEIVIDRALRRLRRWSGGHFEAAGPWLAISIPGARLACGAVLDWLRPMMSRYSIPASHVMLEISELASVRHPREAIETLTIWRDLGGSVAIEAAALDDRLPDMPGTPFDAVKLDACLVAAITDQGRGESCVAAVIERASRAGARVIAEGLETDEQRRALTHLGCAAARGPLVGLADPELTRPTLPLYTG